MNKIKKYRNLDRRYYCSLEHFFAYIKTVSASLKMRTSPVFYTCKLSGLKTSGSQAMAGKFDLLVWILNGQPNQLAVA